ncbi:MAG TPA: S8 family serine peptidase [Terriglobia bacterium]|nr:S8 family serine peptidase [Terriglobia bacterium]
MKRLLVIAGLLFFTPMLGAREKSAPVTIAVRALPDGSSSLLIHVVEMSGPVDEARVELPGNTSRTAVLMSGPPGWTLERDGGAVRLSGAAASAPLRFRLTLFDLKEIKDVKVRMRREKKNVLDKSFKATLSPALEAPGSTAGLIEFPLIVSPGETIEAAVLDSGLTPPDGQWIIAGVVAERTASGRIRARLPDDLQPGTPVRVSYFDVWGERIVDSLSADDTVVSSAAEIRTPHVRSCPAYSFLGSSLCVCGDFPEQTSSALRIDGQPATVLAASRHVARLLLPATMTPGPHVVTGDPTAGFPAGDRAATVALGLDAILDRTKVMKGQSTTFRLVVSGTTDPMPLTISNENPRVVSISGGGNYQVANTSGGRTNAVERRVQGVGAGNFRIVTRLEGPTCPCLEQARESHPSTASRPAPVVVPRRVLATVAAATPAATLGVAQAIALANGLSVVEVIPLATANLGMVVFEITDGVGAVAKAAALAADPRVTLAQPDFVYDTSQASSSPPGQLLYGLRMIGADRAQTVTRGEGVRVGVIDAGIDTASAALAKKVVDYTDVTRTGWTPDAHGTLVAGVIASDPVPGSVSGGVAPGVQLVAIKACVAESRGLASARCWSSTLARGIDLATAKNVRVMNLSVGGPEDKLLAKMVENAAGKGITVVAAAGNDGPSGRPSYPAAFDKAIAVTAVDATSRLYPQATRGAFVDIAAPGVDILSAGPGGRAQIFSGTSAATAFGAGAVALLLRQRPNLTEAELLALLRETARDLGAAGPDPEFGYGLLDVCRAMVKLGRKMTCQ